MRDTDNQHVCVLVCITGHHPALSHRSPPAGQAAISSAQTSAVASSRAPGFHSGPLQCEPEGPCGNQARQHHPFPSEEAKGFHATCKPHPPQSALCPHPQGLSPLLTLLRLMASLLFLKHISHAPTSGPLHRLFPLPGIIFPQYHRCMQHTTF